MILGRNRAADRTWREDWPNQRMLRRINAERRGRKVPERDSEIDDGEWAEIVELAEGAKKQNFETGGR